MCKLEGTSVSPFEAMYGFEPVFDEFGRNERDSTLDDDPEEFRRNEWLRMRKLIDEAKLKREQRSEDQARVIENLFKVGDEVLIDHVDNPRSQFGVISKIEPRFVGPFKVLRFVNPRVVKLEMPR